MNLTNTELMELNRPGIRGGCLVWLASTTLTGQGNCRQPPNVASVLKAEIERISRKEIRKEVESLKKAVNAQRSAISALKRQTQKVELEIRRVGKSLPKPVAASAPLAADDSTKSLRFSAKGLAAHRQRLGLSADDCGLLLGASGQSIYNWEAGKAKPRASFLPAIAALRELGKTQAAELVASRKAK